MYVVSVVPITRGAFKDHLSFFSKHPLSPGLVVTVPLRGKDTPALVVASSDAREEKFALRESPYALKKMSAASAKRVFPESTVRAFTEIARRHALPLGSVLAFYTPRAVTSSLAEVHEVENSPPREAVASDILALQAEREERIRMYRNVARESFARGQSVVVVAPTIIEAETLYDALHRGIEQQVVLLTGAQSAKTLRTMWNRVAGEASPLLVVCTPSLMAVPKSSVGAYIVEHEHARSLRNRERPHLDARVSVEILANASGARLIVADFPLRIETRERLRAGELEELMRLQISSQHRTTVTVIDARRVTAPDLPRSKKPFSVFAEQTARATAEELARGGRVFLYANRTGLAPITVCNDCGTPISDPVSKTPMSLHKTESGNVFMSHYSGAVVSSNISCQSCGSWNLVSLGIGVERVIDEAKKLFPDVPLLALTAERAPTHAKAVKIRDQFFGSAPHILVGTDRALPYLTEPVELSVVVSIDSLLSIPAWRAGEYALDTLFTILDRTERSLFVQTRSPDSPVMQAIRSRNPTEFIRHELDERRTFAYPPFATFVSLSWSGTERGVARLASELAPRFNDYEVVGPLPMRATGKNRFLSRLVIRLAQGAWPDTSLIERLKALPNEVAVSIDPDEIV